jgi:hypothetical protein
MFHLKCTTVSKTIYTELKRPDCQVLWFCNACGAGARNVLKNMADIQSKYDALLERVSKLENSSVETSSMGQQVPIDEIVQKAVSATVNEMHDMKRRENNVVIFGLDEQEGDGHGAVGHESDTHKVKHVLAAIGITDNDFTASRLGRSVANKPRILRVRFANVDTKYSTLSVAKNLRNVGYPKVYIKPDLTRRQLSEQRDLVIAMKSANENGRRVRISRGKLVPLDAPATGGPTVRSAHV